MIKIRVNYDVHKQWEWTVACDDMKAFEDHLAGIVANEITGDILKAVGVPFSFLK